MKNIENDAYGHFPYLIAVRIRDISGSDKNNVIYPQCTKCSEHNFFDFFCTFGIIARG